MRKLRIPEINAKILRGTFFVARCTGLVFFRFKNSQDNVLAFEESGWDFRWWKWLTGILRLVPLCVIIYLFTWMIREEEQLLRLIIFTQLVVSIPSYLSMIHLHIFRGPEMIKLINRYFILFRQLRSLTVGKQIGFGGGRELILIMLFFVLQFQEVVDLLGYFPLNLNAAQIASSACFSYAVLASNMILRVSFIWHLSVSVLFTEVQKCIRFELQSQTVQPRNHHRRLKRIMAIFIEISDVVSSLNGITNVYLFFNLVHKLYFVVVLSSDMIIHLLFIWKIFHWILFIKVIIEVFVLILVIQESINQFRYIHELSLDLFLATELKDWHKTVEIFVTHLNLNKFRVRPLDLFDVSCEFFLIIVSGIVTYLVFVVQCVMQRRNMQL
ncbi:putative gustatory receptor 93b [Drosophila biarmipes]|uniref:putative gustatory receptor 93b n=1 Tax=Drosophila biarmipes TaxID=125945 RepID=UPI001CDA5B2D|nr:putative gustatory receptor 93b [Drosophila biarmipes]